MKNEKTTCILFKSVFDAALEFAKENKKELALDILLSYGKYAFGYTDEVRSDSMIAKLIVNQNIPALDAAMKKYDSTVAKKEKPRPASKKDALYQYADENRENPTDAERRFKKFLGKNNIDYKFQVPVFCSGEGYIIDFVIHSKKTGKDIAVEIDGGYHDEPEQVRKDEIRDKNLKRCGYDVVRLRNEETEKDKVYDATFRKMRLVGASDVLNKITSKRHLN